MSALQDINFEQAMTLASVFAAMATGGIWMLGRVAFGMEGR